MSFGLVFIACELCERVSEAFERIEDVMDQLNWYGSPTEIKRILPMIIVNTQEPVSIECFGSISCSRMVFQKVFSFMLLNRDKLYQLIEFF